MTETNPYLAENKILEYCLEVLASLAESQFYQQKLKDNHVILQVWKLLKIPKINICQKAVSFFENINNIAVHLSSET